MNLKRFWFMLGGLLLFAGALLWEVVGPGPVRWNFAPVGVPPVSQTAPPTPLPGFQVGPASCHTSEPAVAPEFAANRDKTRGVAVRYRLEPLVFLWQIQQESGFNPTAVSPTGALGIAQLQPGTAAALQPPVDPWNVDSALDGAARLDLSELHFYRERSLTLAQRFGGNQNTYVWGLALAAYNAGGRAVNAALAWADRLGWKSAWTYLSAPYSAAGWDQGQTSRYVRAILGCGFGGV